MQVFIINTKEQTFFFLLGTKKQVILTHHAYPNLDSLNRTMWLSNHKYIDATAKTHMDVSPFSC